MFLLALPIRNTKNIEELVRKQKNTKHNWIIYFHGNKMSETSIIIFFPLTIFFTENIFLKFFSVQGCPADYTVDSHYIIV